MNNLRMKWNRAPGCHIRPAAAPEPTYMTDERLELLANRYQANRIRYVLRITFAVYLLAPEEWDRIAKYMQDGGGCRIVEGNLIPNEVRHA